jgi:hypothetical protein
LSNEAALDIHFAISAIVLHLSYMFACPSAARNVVGSERGSMKGRGRGKIAKEEEREK